MRDALTNFGNVAITSSATGTASSVGSENIVNMTAPGKTEVTPQMCRIVFYPKTKATGTFTFELKGADAVTGYAEKTPYGGDATALSSPAVVQKFELKGINVGEVQKFPFPLEVKNKYYQIFGYGPSVANVEVWFEFGA